MLQLIQQLLNHLITDLKRSYKAALAGMATVLLVLSSIFWLILSSYGVQVGELTKFVATQKQQRATVAEQLKAINKKVNDAETESHNNQRQLVEIVQRLVEKDQNALGNIQGFRRLLNISAENQDIIRALMEFGRIYAALVESNEHDEYTHRHLSDLYQALLEITLDDPLDGEREFNKEATRQLALTNKKSVCALDPTYTICRAKARLERVQRAISDFPRSVKNDVEIEVLRYLSYCAARALEINNQMAYTQTAEDIRDAREMGLMDPRPYRRKYYWIDYSKLIAAVKSEAPGYDVEADKYFKKLQQHLAPHVEFLRLKLIQHKGQMTSQLQKEYWNKLISRAAPNSFASTNAAPLRNGDNRY